ncbi:MAG: deoxyribonuclease V [Planctomycetes bacterium]|nr:deoxyribonuclease V [Planctomycetota bacterium]
MEVKKLHKWDITYEEARSLQEHLASKLRFTPVRKTPKLIAGIDCAFSKDGKRIGAAVIVMDFPELNVIETKTATAEVTYPYIPGLLSFREAPVCIKAVEKLENTPDVFLVDGQGIAHQRKLGLAAHLGLFFDKPTIGCAKSRLVGEYKEPEKEKGSYSPLTYKGEQIGAVVRTRTNVKPLFISVGNKCGLDFAIKTTLACTKKYRLPEPTRLAHQTVTKLKPEI